MASSGVGGWIGRYNDSGQGAHQNQVSTNRIVVQEYTTSTSAEEINAFYY